MRLKLMTMKDHLGNNRIVAKGDGTIEQHMDYYPYGGHLSFSTNMGTPKYKYIGKEYDHMHGLNEYDYGARRQNPVVGQFTSMDPLCEKYYHLSPYSYCGGDPVNRVDPDGQDYRLIFDHKDRTITIFANYELKNGAEDVFDKAKEYWNNLSFMIGNYSVSFDINSNADENGNYLNTFNVVDADNYVSKEDTGATKDGHNIVLYNGRYSVDTGIHEIGHSLGLVHYTEDDANTNIMYWNAGERTNNIVTKQQVENILYYARQQNPDAKFSLSNTERLKNV